MDLPRNRLPSESRSSLSKKTTAPTGRSVSSRWRIAVAAQPALFRQLLSRELSRESEFVVVGSAGSEEEITAILAREDPRILLIDYEGLGPDCESCVHHIRAVAPATRILVLARRSGDDTIERVLRAGASGLVGKERAFSEVVRAIRAVMAGEIWANRRATAQVLQALTAKSRRPPPRELTEREREIADACARGLRNREIARLVRISEKTVKGHLNTIFRKLGIGNRLELGLRILDGRSGTGPKF